MVSELKLGLDVGGGFSRVAPVERRSAWAEATSNPSLLWMVGQIEKANVGVIWVDDTSDHARKVWHYLKEVSSGGSALNDTVFNPIKELARNPIRDERSALTRVVRRAFEFLPLADDFNAVTGKRGLRIVYVGLRLSSVWLLVTIGRVAAGTPVPEEKSLGDNHPGSISRRNSVSMTSWITSMYPKQALEWRRNMSMPRSQPAFYPHLPP